MGSKMFATIATLALASVCLAESGAQRPDMATRFSANGDGQQAEVQEILTDMVGPGPNVAEKINLAMRVLFMDGDAIINYLQTDPCQASGPSAPHPAVPARDAITDAPLTFDQQKDGRFTAHY